MPDPVLFVEDDAPLRTILSRSLRAHGYGVVEAGSAEEAREILDRGVRPSLVLLDLNLPGATGWELLRGGPLAVDGAPPVVVVSAIGVSHRMLRDLKVAGYLPKPFALETLLEVCDRFTSPQPDPADDAIANVAGDEKAAPDPVIKPRPTLENGG